MDEDPGESEVCFASASVATKSTKTHKNDFFVSFVVHIGRVSVSYVKERRRAEYRLPRAFQTLPSGRWWRDAAPAILECARQAVFRATPLSSVWPHIQPLATASRSKVSTLSGRGRRFQFFDFDSDFDPDFDNCHDPVACGAAGTPLPCPMLRADTDCFLPVACGPPGTAGPT